MKKFTFVLQPVLEHRERIEDEKQQVMATCQRELDGAEAELKRLNDEFRSNTAELRTKHQGLDADALRLYYAHLQFIDRCIVAQIQVVAERRLALDRARIDLLAASKDRKVVDKLKDRRREAHELEEMRVEQNELDDTNARRYSRAHVGGTP